MAKRASAWQICNTVAFLRWPFWGPCYGFAMESLFKYQGADWIGMIFGLASTLCLAKEMRVGFILGILCGAGWFVFGILSDSIASVLSNTLVMAFNAHGWWRWKKKNLGSSAVALNRPSSN